MNVWIQHIKLTEKYWKLLLSLLYCLGFFVCLDFFFSFFWLVGCFFPLIYFSVWWSESVHNGVKRISGPLSILNKRNRLALSFGGKELLGQLNNSTVLTLPNLWNEKLFRSLQIYSHYCFGAWCNIALEGNVQRSTQQCNMLKTEM